MKILFCLNGPNELNGPNVWLTRHLPLLRERGLEVEILYLAHADSGACRYRLLFEQQGFRIRDVAMRGFVEERAKAIVEALDADRPDVFVPNYSIPAYYAARFLREAGVVTVGTLHSDDPYYHDIVDYFVTGPDLWRLSGVVGVSDFITEMMTSRYVSEIPYMHASYGAPVPHEAAQRSDDSLRLIYTGRLVELQKRIGRLTRRLVAVAKRWSEVEAVLYGSGSESVLVADIIGEAKLGNQVRLGGELGPDEVPQALLQGHVFVLLSDFEGLSIALMEAMACGLVPVISRMDSGTSDLIESGVNGFIIDADDPDAFDTVIGQLLNDREMWARMSRAARRAIIERGYTPESCADRWVSFAEDLCAGNERSGTISIPPFEAWDMPPESHRVDGLRHIENRSLKTQLIQSEAGGRPLFFWGAGAAGVNFLKTIGREEFPIHGFIDSDARKQEGKVEGLPVFSADILDGTIDGCRPFVVITSSYGHEITQTLEEKGYQRILDFV